MKDPLRGDILKRAAIMILALFLSLSFVNASVVHETQLHAETQPRYAPLEEELTKERLSFQERSHGVLEQGWVISQVNLITPDNVGELEYLRGAEVREFEYGEEVEYSVHEKGLRVVILELSSIDAAKEIYLLIMKHAVQSGNYEPSNEFGYEGYASTERSRLPEMSSFRRGKFIVWVEGLERAIHYDVKMMALKTDNKLKEYSRDEDVILEITPWMRLDSRGLVLGSITIPKILIIGTGVVTGIFSLVALFAALAYVKREEIGVSLRPKKLESVKEKLLIRV
jgi:hypothetical protein